ncbi:Long-chain-fatty-acid--CoA ligase OS=Lysinibacillus sphaericus OX=1421 GN=LYSIN_01959 PE=3 SV=1 [Lysinibacillus sphaericus]
MFTPQLLADLIEQYKVTLTAGVPTIWLGVLQAQRQQPRDLSSLRSIICGGSASPIGLVRGFEEEQKIPYFTGYGMTETSPLVSLSTYLSHMEHYTTDEKMHVRTTQGSRCHFLICESLMNMVRYHGTARRWEKLQ